MKFYTLSPKIGENSSLISIQNNEWVMLGQGHLLAQNFEEPVLCELDEEFESGEMATLYQDRGVIATQAFCDQLMALGVDNIEVKNAVVRSADGSREYANYRLLNILGRIAGADLDASEVQSLGDGMNIIDSLVMRKDAVGDSKIFVVDEDPDCIVVNQQIYEALSVKYADLYFAEVTLV